jgi:hypothetical protein
MMDQIDEIKSDRVFRMSYEEFLEALARVAFSIDIQPIGPTEVFSFLINFLISQFYLIMFIIIRTI